MKRISAFILFVLPSLYSLSNGRDSIAIKNLVFEGAGIRGIAYCGALMELEERNLLDCVENVAGTSSGAITASLYSIGYTSSEIFDVVGNTDFGKFNDGGWGFIGGISRMRRKLGYYHGQAFLHWLEDLVESKTGKRDLTFAELHQMKTAQTGCAMKDLVIAATSMNHQCSVYFSVETYPQMRIVDAVHASMAIPLYFEPVVVSPTGGIVKLKEMTEQDHLCVDGGFTANFIINYFDTKSESGEWTIAPTIGLRLDSQEQIIEDKGEKKLAYQEVADTKDFIAAFYYIVKETLNRQALTINDWDRTISISDCALGPKVKKMSVSEKDLLINSGRKGVKEYFGEID